MAELEALLADLDAESADADRLVADLPPSRWATPTPAPRAGPSPTRSPTCLDRRAVAAGRHRPGRLRRRSSGARRSPTRCASSTPARSRARRAAARPSCSTAGAPGRRRARRRAGRRAGRHEAALVRPADERRLDGHRPASWRPGRTARTSPTRSASPRTPTGAAAPRRPPRRPRPRLRLRRPRPRRARRAVPGRADRPRRRRCGRWGPDDARAPGHRPGARLLPAGHPAPAPRRPRLRADGRRRRRLAGHRPGLRRPARRSRPRQAAASAERPAPT